jgi:hypothetical protein
VRWIERVTSSTSPVSGELLKILNGGIGGSRRRLRDEAYF